MTGATAPALRIAHIGVMLRQIIPLVASLSTLVATLYAYVVVA